MRYSIRRLFDYWINSGSRRPGPIQLESDEDSKAEGSHHHTAGGSQSPIVDPLTHTNDAALALQFSRAAKRAFDIIVAVVGLVVFSPTFLLVSIAIKVDSRGPIFRRHRLYGYAGEEILVWSFRFNEVTPRATSSPRATRIGRILRSSGVEEFPRLINILSGEMSVVGPEPFLAAPGILLQDQFLLRWRRLKMRPGVIGWAQVNGRGGEINRRAAIQRRIAYDLYYIENWSLILDLKIIAMSVFPKNT